MAQGVKGTRFIHTADTLFDLAHAEPNTGCFLWMGAVTGGTGYGLTRHDGKTVGAHRLMYRLVHGDITPGNDVCHRCDVRSCINPTHLFQGTRKENLADMRAKGRNNDPRGERHPKAKLTADDVRAIRAALAAGEGYRKLGTRYGVSRQSIADIKHGRHWNHVAQERT